MIDQILDHNRNFVASKGYERYITDKYPDKKLAVLSCMDTRLTELLPAALGLKNGDAKIIKNAGGNFRFLLGHAQPYSGYLRAWRRGDYGGGPLTLRRLPHELRPFPPPDDCPWRCRRHPRHHTQMRHRPRPLAGRLQGHTLIGAKNRGDNQNPPAGAKGHNGARFHHRLRNGSTGRN